MSETIIIAAPVAATPAIGADVANCLIYPKTSGILKDCVKFEMPSSGKVFLIVVISLVLLLAVAYAIYWFVNSVNPGFKLNYWIILLILILSGLIVGLFV
jgi:hypothetical protein